MERSELKFRLWLGGKMLTDKDDGFYDYTMTLDGELLNEDNIEYRSFTVKGKYVIMQFTGLHDKNGKEIYEGDILSDKEELWKVIFYKAGYWAKFIGGKEGIVPLDWRIETGKIISNIYENQELLEEGEDGVN